MKKLMKNLFSDALADAVFQLNDPEIHRMALLHHACPAELIGELYRSASVRIRWL